MEESFKERMRKGAVLLAIGELKGNGQNGRGGWAQKKMSGTLDKWD